MFAVNHCEKVSHPCYFYRETDEYVDNPPSRPTLCPAQPVRGDAPATLGAAAHCIPVASCQLLATPRPSLAPPEMSCRGVCQGVASRQRTLTMPRCFGSGFQCGCHDRTTRMRNAVLLLAYFGKVAALSGGLCDHDLRSNRPDAPDVCLHRSCASCADAESCCRKHFNSRCCLRRIRRLGSTCRHPKDVDCMLPPLFTSAPPTALCGSGIRDALNATCCAA